MGESMRIQICCSSSHTNRPFVINRGDGDGDEWLPALAGRGGILAGSCNVEKLRELRSRGGAGDSYRSL
jgi:hypothetical protein